MVLREIEIDIKVIYNSLAYTAGAFHNLKRPRLAKALAGLQNKAFRTVMSILGHFNG